MLKNRIIVIVFFFITACSGYVPLYKDLEKTNFELEIINFNGDNYINNNIKNNLRKYSKTGNTNKVIYKLTINTEYEKKGISKNQSGNTTDYELKTITTVNITSQNLNKETIITEKFNMKSMSDNFEEAKYEKTVNNNFANSIARKIISIIFSEL